MPRLEDTLLAGAARGQELDELLRMVRQGCAENVRSGWLDEKGCSFYAGEDPG
jgi:hypothetical protein